MKKKPKKINSKNSQIHTGILVLENKKVFKGIGIGYQGIATGEVCFNTSLTGYQEIISDPSYAGQIINFTFPHIGNVGTNKEDYESDHGTGISRLVECGPGKVLSGLVKRINPELVCIGTESPEDLSIALGKS